MSPFSRSDPSGELRVPSRRRFSLLPSSYYILMVFVRFLFIYYVNITKNRISEI